MGHPRLETRHHPEPFAAPAARNLIRRDGDRVGAELEAVGRHADDEVRLSVDNERFVEDGGITPELPRPEPFAQDHHLVFPVLLFVGAETAAEAEGNAKGREVLRGDALSHQPLRLAALGEVGFPSGEAGALLEDPVLVVVEAKSHGGDPGVQVDGLVAMSDQLDPLRLPERQGPEQDSVDHTEDRGIRADAERDRQEGGEGEPR